MIAISTQNLCLAQTFLLRLRLSLSLSQEPGIWNQEYWTCCCCCCYSQVPKDDEDEAAANLLAMRPICSPCLPLCCGTEGEGATKQPAKQRNNQQRRVVIMNGGA